MIKEFRSLFDIFTDGKSSLTREEFIGKMGAIYSHGEIHKMLMKQELENSQKITIDQFLLMLKPSIYTIPKTVLQNIK